MSIDGIEFEWDEVKNESKVRKHGISFDKAIRVFADPLHITRWDRIENGEMRWQTFGLVGGVQILMVAYTIEDQSGGELFRLISARRATKIERRDYENENG